MVPREPLTLQILCNRKVMGQLTDIYLRRVLKEPELPTLNALFFCQIVYTAANKTISPPYFQTQEHHKVLCDYYRSLLREIDYTDFPSLKKDNTFDVREIAMFMEEMKRKGFLVVNRREELPEHLTTYPYYDEAKYRST